MFNREGGGTLDSVLVWENVIVAEARSCGTSSRGISQFYLHTHAFILPAFAFPAEAGFHLPTPEGWKAELA